MSKLWAGRASGETDKTADDFNSSISVDLRMYAEDIEGSIAHAKMLAKQGIISASDAENIISGLEEIKDDIDSGDLAIDPAAEDIHMFIEQQLTERIGSAGKKVHTARSRNDQIALDERLYLRGRIAEIKESLKGLCTVIVGKAEEYGNAVMPGYTHLQRAQPILFSHQLMAYVSMFLRDISRLEDCLARMNVSPIGSCALGGTTYDTDRRYEASLLGFDDICANSIDGVSDRDYCIELLSCISIAMMHLSRLSEEIILWSSREFNFIELSEGFTTGSSIMPQKKNPDMAELVRGKTGRVYGDLVAMLTVMKGLPLAYNKDMQEDKEAVFDAVDSLKMCLKVFIPMIETMKAFPENMKKAAAEGFINATDLADYLVKRGMPFREAYRISGKIVADCIERSCTLEDYPLADYKEYSELFADDVYGEIDIAGCVSRRISEGGTGKESLKKQIAAAKEKLG